MKNIVGNFVRSVCNIFLLLTFTVIIAVFIGFINAFAIMGILISVKIIFVYFKKNFSSNINFSNNLDSSELNKETLNIVNKLELLEHINKQSGVYMLLLIPILFFGWVILNNLGS